MLISLQIRHFAIAEELLVSTSKGLNVITGETGAGKSIMIRALSLLLGQRADLSMIKHGKQRAEIQANFEVSNQPKLVALLHYLSLDDEQECQLRRIISVESGSKAFVNGRQVTLRVLHDIGEHLLNIHGQHEHQFLLQADKQRELLDQYANIQEDVLHLGVCYQELNQAIKQLNILQDNAISSQDKRSYLQFQADELDRFSPKNNEWEALQIQHQRIHNQAQLSENIISAEHALFRHEHNASEQLSTALHALSNAQEIDPSLTQVQQILLESQTLLNEAEGALNAASESVIFDESELAQIEQRYTTYVDLSQKHKIQPNALFSFHEGLLKQLADMDSPQLNEQAHRKNILSLTTNYQTLSTKISQQRKHYAKKLSTQVSELMQTLAMKGGTFNVRISPVNSNNKLIDETLSLEGVGHEWGNDQIYFEVSTNTGIPVMPLGKIASGGEISRISLALQLILSDQQSAPTLIFDEVDVGVGGKTAAIIGRLLAKLAQNRQIICITHLGQVAAFGNNHFHIEKNQNEHVQLKIIKLDESQRIEEIARMVGGELINTETRAHARALLKQSIL